LSDVALGLVDAVGQLALVPAVGIKQAFVGRGLLDRVQVSAVEILGDGQQVQRGQVVGLADGGFDDGGGFTGYGGVFFVTHAGQADFGETSAPVAQGVRIREQLPQGERRDGASAALAGDQLVVAVVAENQDGIDEALVNDAARQFEQGGGVEVLARLPARRSDGRDVDLDGFVIH